LSLESRMGGSDRAGTRPAPTSLFSCLTVRITVLFTISHVNYAENQIFLHRIFTGDEIKLKEFKCDLHMHTCLSPCADLEMSPLAIVKKAAENKLDIIAITDHNSAENITAAQKASENMDLTVLAGMEIASSEEAHILAFFDDNGSIMELQDIVYENLLPGENDEKMFGEQIVVNEKDEVLGYNNRLLIGATLLTAQEIVNTAHSLGGLAIASHIDKEAFSIISQLGFIPEDLEFDALEMSPNINREKADELFSMYTSFTWISSSDAHYLNDIGKRTTSFYINEPTLKEMALAMKNIDGRRVEW
ncbi:MAG: PHP domain-containing protein, partial [Thermodesulfovibrionia bacterium]|nr:PHP domain-containing protein [Thermodesulfovibrionia bacterium]